MQVRQYLTFSFYSNSSRQQQKLHFRETNVSNADKRYRQEFEGGPTTNNTKMEVKPVIHNNRSQILNRNHNPGNTGKETIYFLR